MNIKVLIISTSKYAYCQNSATISFIKIRIDALSLLVSLPTTLRVVNRYQNERRLVVDNIRPVANTIGGQTWRLVGDNTNKGRKGATSFHL